MKKFSLLLCIISPIAYAQPDFDEPCSGYENIYLDVNEDGTTDIMMYVGAEGTDDVPSSYGFCQYRIAIPNGGFISVGQERVFVDYKTVLRRDEIEYKQPRELSTEAIQDFPYGGAAIDYTPERRYPTFYNYIPYWMVDNGDTLIGWVCIYNGGLDEVPHFESHFLTDEDDVSVGEYTAPSAKFADLGWTSGLNVGSYINFYEATPGPVGGHLNYYLQYGVVNPGWNILYIQSELGIDALPTVSQMGLGPVWTNKIHFVIFDFGVSTGYYPNIDDGILISRWEAGLSIKNWQLMIYGPLTSGANAALPGGGVPGLMVNYTFPLTGIGADSPRRVFVN